MSTGVATGTPETRTPQLVLLAAVVIAVAFGAAFAVATLTKDDSSNTSAPQATPIEPSSSSPELPATPPAAELPALKPPPAPEGGGSGAPPSESPAPAPTPAPAPDGGGGGGGGGGGTIIEG